MTTRALAAAVLAALLLPAAASAATRPVQAFDQPEGHPPVWTPSQLSAQPGDTVRFQFEQPGNPNAAGASHDVFLVRPGQPESKLGVSYLNPTVEAALDQEGTYSFFCSIHRDSMSGTIAVAAGEPTPVVDPGRPWESPAPVIDSGPPPALNTSSPPAAWEEGDNVAPTMTRVRVSRSGRSARVRARVSEAGTFHLRVLRGNREVAERRVRVKAGAVSASVRLPARHGRYRLAIYTRDKVGISCEWRFRTITVR
jgi:plastocyanin